jgi:hypothetical protein
MPLSTFSPTQSEVSWKQTYFEARMPGTNGEYLEGEASPKCLPCLRSLLQPHFGAAPEVFQISIIPKNKRKQQEKTIEMVYLQQKKKKGESRG